MNVKEGDVRFSLKLNSRAEPRWLKRERNERTGNVKLMGICILLVLPFISFFLPARRPDGNQQPLPSIKARRGDVVSQSERSARQAPKKYNNGVEFFFLSLDLVSSPPTIR